MAAAPPKLAFALNFPATDLTFTNIQTMAAQFMKANQRIQIDVVNLPDYFLQAPQMRVTTCYLIFIRIVGREHAHGRGCCRHDHRAYHHPLFGVAQVFRPGSARQCAENDGALKRSNPKAVRRALSRGHLQLSGRSDLVQATDRGSVRGLVQQLRMC